jgi:hypothetical protein
MVYTSGVVTDLTREETLEELQDNKMTLVCEKLDLKPDGDVPSFVSMISRLNILQTVFLILAAAGVRSSSTPRRTTAAQLPVLPSPATRPRSRPTALRRMV